AHIIMLHIRHEQPQCRMHAWCERNENGRNTQVQRHPAGVPRSAAAEGDESEVADVVAARRRYGLDRLLHFYVDDLEHAVGGLEEIQLERLRYLLFEQLVRLGFVE